MCSFLVILTETILQKLPHNLNIFQKPTKSTIHPQNRNGHDLTSLFTWGVKRTLRLISGAEFTVTQLMRKHLVLKVELKH